MVWLNIEELSKEGSWRAIEYGSSKVRPDRVGLEKLIEETLDFRESLDDKLRRGRDRLLELNSSDPGIAKNVIEEIREAESDNWANELLWEHGPFWGSY